MAIRATRHNGHGRSSLAAAIDHTNLQATATAADITELCRQAMEQKFQAVCVHAHWLSLARQILHGSPVRLVAVVDFPHGASLAATRRQSAVHAVEAGADELDVVVALPSVMEGNWSAVQQDTAGIVNAVGPDTTVKVILEAGLLDGPTLAAAARSVMAAGAHFLKTGTGTGPAATPEMVATLAALAQEHNRLTGKLSDPVQVKAAGGIRTGQQARAMLAAGATRLGTSSGVKLVTTG